MTMTMAMTMMMTATTMTMTMLITKRTTTVAVVARQQRQLWQGARWATVAAAKVAGNESFDGCMGVCDDESGCQTTMQQPTK